MRIAIRNWASALSIAFIIPNHIPAIIIVWRCVAMRYDAMHFAKKSTPRRPNQTPLLFHPFGWWILRKIGNWPHHYYWPRLTPRQKAIFGTIETRSENTLFFIGVCYPKPNAKWRVWLRFLPPCWQILSVALEGGTGVAAGEADRHISRRVTR